MRAIEGKRWFVFVVSIYLATLAGQASAQTPASRYSPARPTTSPYFNLFRSDTGGIPNYQMFYQRDENLRSSLRRQELQIGTLQQSVRTGGEVLSDIVTGRRQRVRRATDQPASRAAVFMTYSQFYPNAGSVRVRRR